MDGNKTSLIDAWKPNNTAKQSANAFRAFQTHLSTLDGDEIIAMNKNKQWANYARGKGFTDSGLLYFLDEADKGRAKVNKMDAEIKKLDKSATGMGATFKNALKNIGANLGIMLAITIAVKALAAAYDHLVVTMEEQQEIVDNLRNEVEDLRVEYDELNNKGNCCV